MVAFEKIAWLEVCLAGSSIVLASALFPWLGNGAIGAFGILGGLGLSVLFIRNRGKKAIIDERDVEIQRSALLRGMMTSWFFSFFLLLGIILWAENSQTASVSSVLLSWVLWVQFALCYLVKGASTLMTYRKQNRATSA